MWINYTGKQGETLKELLSGEQCKVLVGPIEVCKFRTSLKPL